MTQEEKYMREAVRQAKKAAALKEVPIGCVIVHDEAIIARGYNRRTIDKNVLAHAEIIAIRKACRKIGDWRLEDCTLYVTLEPCQMCSGAIVQARIKRVVVGCMNPKAGCAGSILNLLDMKEFNHQVELTTGVLEEQCSGMMKKIKKRSLNNSNFLFLRKIIRALRFECITPYVTSVVNSTQAPLRHPRGSA